MRPLSRRTVLSTSVAAAVLALGRRPRALAADPAAAAGEDVVPFLEPQPFDPKRPMLLWDQLDPGSGWLTPTPSVYHVSHYGEQKLDAAAHKLQITGLVDK